MKGIFLIIEKKKNAFRKFDLGSRYLSKILTFSFHFLLSKSGKSALTQKRRIPIWIYHFSL